MSPPRSKGSAGGGVNRRFEFQNAVSFHPHAQQNGLRPRCYGQHSGQEGHGQTQLHAKAQQISHPVAVAVGVGLGVRVGVGVGVRVGVGVAVGVDVGVAAGVGVGVGIGLPWIAKLKMSRKLSSFEARSAAAAVNCAELIVPTSLTTSGTPPR